VFSRPLGRGPTRGVRARKRALHGDRGWRGVYVVGKSRHRAHTESQREESGESQFQGSLWRATLSREAWMPIWGLSTESMSPGRLPDVARGGEGEGGGKGVSEGEGGGKGVGEVEGGGAAWERWRAAEAWARWKAAEA